MTQGLYADERIDRVNEDISLIQKKDGLTFGTDAFLLAAFMKPQKYARAVELGAGTGIISLLAASAEKFSFISAVEIQKDFFDVTERNIAHNGFSDRIRAIHADIRDILPTDIGGEADVVFSNPPYMRTDSGKRNESDRKYIARHEVCGEIGDFCRCTYRLLKHGGRFYCVWRPDRLTGLIYAMRENRIEPKSAVFVHGDCLAVPSMVLVSGVKGGAEGMRILPPLFLHEPIGEKNGVRKMTQRAEEIYDTLSF